MESPLDEIFRLVAASRPDLQAEREQLQRTVAQATMKIEHVDRLLALSDSVDPMPLAPPTDAPTSAPPEAAAREQAQASEAAAQHSVPESSDPEGPDPDAPVDRVAMIKRRLERMQPGTVIYEVHEAMKAHPDAIFTAEMLNDVLAARGLGQASSDPVGGVRNTLSKLWRGERIERIERGRFRYRTGGMRTDDLLEVDDDEASVEQADEEEAM